MNPMDLFRIKGCWDRFTSNHPKFPLFLKAVGQDAFREGTILEMKVTTAEGENYTSNLKLTADDMALFEEMRQMMQNMR